MRRDAVYLLHILDAIKKIRRYAAAGHAEFMAQSHWQDATIRQLEIIGEATKRLSEEMRSAHPHIPWRRIAGLRDVLIHDYMGVDLNVVWNIIQGRIPELEDEIRAILGKTSQDR